MENSYEMAFHRLVKDITNEEDICPYPDKRVCDGQCVQCIEDYYLGKSNANFPRTRTERYRKRREQCKQY